MEDMIVAFIFSLYGLFAITCFILLIYLIFRRINLKDRENFEKRDF